MNLPPSAEIAERGAWAQIDGNWQRLFGDFFQDGVSIEWHDFATAEDHDWGRSFHPHSLELCLNFAGDSSVGALEMGAGAAGFYTRAEREVGAYRCGGGRHQFITVEMSRPFLRQHLAGSAGELAPAVRDFLSTKRSPPVAGTRPLNAVQQTLRASLLSPPVSAPAQPLWYRAKVFELMSQFLFEEPKAELFCAKHKRLSRERVVRAEEILRANLESPPDLAELARGAGCSPFYFSRLFSEETGMTIPQFVRKARIEKAAALLLSGKFNVTEAALEVGYASLSHFSRAFCETTGYCPALYAAMMAPRAARRD